MDAERVGPGEPARAPAVAGPGGAGAVARAGTTTSAVVPVLAAVGVAIWGIAVLHVVGSGSLDPLAHTLSDYVALPAGYLVLGVAAGAMALAGTLLAITAHRAGAGPVPVALLGSWALAMALAGIFPTNAPGTPADLVAAVHRYAGAWVFAALPVAALLLARGPAVAAAARRTVTAVAGAAGALAGVFLLAHVPIVVLGSPVFPLLGGVERVLYGVVSVLLIAIARSFRTGVPA